MEENVQVFLGVFISIFLLFIFPVYMAFEKKDDVAYVLALRFTQEFVDTARSKGYITKDMYADYRNKLAVTGNHYDIVMTHEQVKLEPMVQYYKKNAEGNLVLEKTTSKQAKDQTDEEALAVGMEHIEAILEVDNKLWLDATTDDFVCVDEGEPEDLSSSPKKINSCKYAYTMNENDVFTVIIKNTNTTPATLMYNMVTGNTLKNNTRIYVNYGGAVTNARWFGKIDYSKMKHDDLDLYLMDLKSFFEDEKEFSKSTPTNTYTYFTEASRGYGYMVEFEARPYDTTDLQKVGTTVATDEIEKYNFAWGTDATNVGMELSVGLNGVCILGRYSSSNTKVLLSYPVSITGYTKIRVRVDRRKVGTNSYKYKAILYVNDKRVGETEELDKRIVVYRLGQGLVNSARQNFE